MPFRALEKHSIEGQIQVCVHFTLPRVVFVRSAAPNGVRHKMAGQIAKARPATLTSRPGVLDFLFNYCCEAGAGLGIGGTGFTPLDAAGASGMISCT